MSKPGGARGDQRDRGHTPAHPEEQRAKKTFGLLCHHLGKLPERSRVRLQSRFAQELVEQTYTVDTPAGSLSFVLLGRMAAGRAMSVLTKQPATIQWIDSFDPNSVFWDVGANVGVYALYAALRNDTRVVALEPAAVNYFLLAANCEANRLDARVDCLVVGLGNTEEIARLEVSQFAPAKSFSFRGRRQPFPGRQAALIISMDRLIDDYQLACPNYIKIDTPGMTEAIIAGGVRTLQRQEVRELHIEVREHSKSGARIVAMLRRSGFVVGSRDEHGGSSDLTFARTSVQSNG